MRPDGNETFVQNGWIRASERKLATYSHNIVPGVSVPTALPACPSVRSEPCRAYQAYSNDGA